MLRLASIFQRLILIGALGLLVVAGSSKAEPPAPDQGTPTKEEKPDSDKAKDPPKEKKPITVPAGTAMMIKTGDEVSSDDKAGRRFSATLQANLLAGDEVVAKAGTQVYGQVMKSAEVGRGVVINQSHLTLSLTDINIEGTMYPIQTGSFSEGSTSVILRRRAVVVPAGSILEFKLTQPLTVKK